MLNTNFRHLICYALVTRSLKDEKLKLCPSIYKKYDKLVLLLIFYVNSDDCAYVMFSVMT